LLAFKQLQQGSEMSLFLRFQQELGACTARDQHFWGRCLWGSALLLASLAQAQTLPTALPADGQAWLRHIDEAAARNNFQGIFIISGKGVLISTTRLTHLLRAGQSFEYLEPLDARGTRVLRLGDQVQMVLPGQKAAVAVGQQGRWGHFPALLHGVMPLANYKVDIEGTDRVAGLEAQVLWVKPRDAHRYGLRLWADRRSGLLLRADTLAPREEETLETWSFADLKVGFTPPPGQLRQLLLPFKGGKAQSDQASAPTQLELQGWALKHSIPGFETMSCVMQTLPNLSAEANRSRRSKPNQVLQAVYSDGLARISLFIEPFDVNTHQNAGQTSMGLTHTITTRQGDWWITAVGAVPLSTLQAFVQGLRRSPA
jgi:sigma-E factor negative regulatory protein RseB